MTIQSKASTPQFRDNFDKTFGKGATDEAERDENGAVVPMPGQRQVNDTGPQMPDGQRRAVTGWHSGVGSIVLDICDGCRVKPGEPHICEKRMADGNTCECPVCAP